MKEVIINGVQVQTDGRTIWLNGPDGINVGRLSEAVMEVRVGVHWITSPCRGEGWSLFQEEVSRLLGFDLPEDFKPEWA